MRLVKVLPESVVGKTIIFRNQFWHVDAVTDHLRLSKYYMGNSTKGRLEFRQLDDCRLYLSHEAVAKGYPRLIKALRFACILTQSEAESCLQGYLTTGSRYIGSEAVAHVGGSLAAIQHAIRCRKLVQRIAHKNVH